MEKGRIPIFKQIFLESESSFACEESFQRTVLDFQSLYSLLSDNYQIAFVEKFGYGFSDIVDKGRDIDSILEDTRAALTAAGLAAPYVLCPHSMSGLEALYWAQKYPNEVSAIIGLDMAVPEYYDNMNINIPFMRFASWTANIGMINDTISNALETIQLKTVAFDTEWETGISLGVSKVTKQSDIFPIQEYEWNTILHKLQKYIDVILSK